MQELECKIFILRTRAAGSTPAASDPAGTDARCEFENNWSPQSPSQETLLRLNDEERSEVQSVRLCEMIKALTFVVCLLGLFSCGSPQVRNDIEDVNSQSNLLDSNGFYSKFRVGELEFNKRELHWNDSLLGICLEDLENLKEFDKDLIKNDGLFVNSFLAQYYSFTGELPDTINEIFCNAFLSSYSNDDYSFGSESFNINESRIDGLNNCVFAIKQTGSSNSEQDKTGLLILQENKELIVLNFDEISISNNGSIRTVFRVKSKRSIVEYKYCEYLSCLLPLRKK